MADFYSNPYHMQSLFQGSGNPYQAPYPTSYMPSAAPGMAPGHIDIALQGVRGMGGYMGGYPMPGGQSTPYSAPMFGGYQPAQAPQHPSLQSYQPMAAAPNAPAASAHSGINPGQQSDASAPGAASPAYTVQSWKDKGWIDQDGNVTLPWGAKVSVQEAMKMYYKDQPPRANEIPAWVETPAPMAAGVPLQYWNSLPADFRNTAQTWFDKAYGSGPQSAIPPITNMQPQGQYHY